MCSIIGYCGRPADLTAFDLTRSYRVDPAQFLTLGRATPFAGWTVQGRCLLTVSNGKVAWSDGTLSTEGAAT